MKDIQEQYTDFYRTGLAATIGIMTATVESAQRLRNHQLAIITQVLTENAALGTQIDSAKKPEELMTVCATLAGNQLRNMSAYWSGFQRVATENQVSLQQRGQAQITEMQHHFSTALEEIVKGGPGSMVEAVKATVGSNATAYGMLSRAAEEMARIAAAQVATADAGIRSATAAKQKTG